MRLGLLAGPGDDWRESLEKVRIAEDLGIELISTGEAWGKGSMPWLAAIALNTSKVTIGTSILNTFSRTPAALAQDFATLIYDGLWFGPLRQAMQAFVAQTQTQLTGDVRVRISAGLARITGRRSPYSLYDDGLATYSDGDTFDRTAAVGFLKLYGLSYATWGRVQRKH